jgi:hypothetical protein
LSPAVWVLVIIVVIFEVIRRVTEWLEENDPDE